MGVFRCECTGEEARPEMPLSIVVGRQSLISEGALGGIGADLAGPSWFQRMSAALRLGGGLGQRANRVGFGPDSLASVPLSA
jgi:hypothetical protein